MVKVIAQLNKLLLTLDATIEQRCLHYEQRSERWQESEKGEAYQELTLNLEDYRQEVEVWIDQLTDSDTYADRTTHLESE